MQLVACSPWPHRSLEGHPSTFPKGLSETLKTVLKDLGF